MGTRPPWRCHFQSENIRYIFNIEQAKTKPLWSLAGGLFASLQSCLIYSEHLLCASAMWDAGKQQWTGGRPGLYSQGANILVEKK